MEDNPVSKTFWGRIKIEAALSRYHFIKSSKIQSILHELKYKGNQELGNVLGRMVANYIKQANYFPTIDFIIPVPLHPKKYRIRGYNQSTLIAQGVSNGLGAPINDNTLLRSLHTKTQTKKGRIARWQNVSDAFALAPKHGLEGKSVLLVDDVVTTGATLEACGAELLKISGLKLSIAAVAYA